MAGSVLTTLGKLSLAGFIYDLLQSWIGDHGGIVYSGAAMSMADSNQTGHPEAQLSQKRNIIIRARMSLEKLGIGVVYPPLPASNMQSVDDLAACQSMPRVSPIAAPPLRTTIPGWMPASLVA